MMNNNEMVLKDSRKLMKVIKSSAIIAIFLALSAAGAMIKIPSPVGTLGLDSAAGFFCAAAFGNLEGAVVIAAGHIITAAMVGFPLTLPVHLFIAVQMALWALAFRWTNRKFGLTAAIVAGIVLNGVVSSFTMLLAGGMVAVISVMPFLVVASALNVIIAGLAYRVIKRSKLI